MVVGIGINRVSVCHVCVGYLMSYLQYVSALLQFHETARMNSNHQMYAIAVQYPNQIFLKRLFIYQQNKPKPNPENKQEEYLPICQPTRPLPKKKKNHSQVSGCKAAIHASCL